MDVILESFEAMEMAALQDGAAKPQGRRKVGNISETGQVTALVKSAAKGDKQAFVALIDLNRQTMYATAMAISQSEADAMDAIQDTILILWEKLDTLRNPKAFKTWMIRILTRRCFRMLRNGKREVPSENVEDTTAVDQLTEYLERDEAVDVQRTLQQLSPDDRLILQLFYFEDMSVRDIAKALSIKSDAVRMRLSRGRKRFLKQYERGGNLL